MYEHHLDAQAREERQRTNHVCIVGKESLAVQHGLDHACNGSQRGNRGVSVIVPLDTGSSTRVSVTTLYVLARSNTFRLSSASHPMHQVQSDRGPSCQSVHHAVATHWNQRLSSCPRLHATSKGPRNHSCLARIFHKAGATEPTSSRCLTRLARAVPSAWNPCTAMTTSSVNW